LREVYNPAFARAALDSNQGQTKKRAPSIQAGALREFSECRIRIAASPVNRLWSRTNRDSSITPDEWTHKSNFFSVLAGDEAVLFIPFQTVRFRKVFFGPGYSETP
jgi:hypothetical protein